MIFFHVVFNFSREIITSTARLKQTSSEYDDDSSDDKDSVLEEAGAEPQLLNKELGFLFTAPRTRNGRMERTSNKAVLWL